MQSEGRTIFSGPRMSSGVGRTLWISLRSEMTGRTSERIGVSNTFLAVMKNPEFARRYLDQCDGTKRSTRMLLREYGWTDD